MVPLKGAWVRVAIICASFHKRETLPCHFSEVFNIGTRLIILRGMIASRYDHTVSNVVLFEGELVLGELVQTDDPLDMDDTLLEIGVEPVTSATATEGPPTHTIYYDCELPHGLRVCFLVHCSGPDTISSVT